MKDVMIDIETLGTRHDAMIIQIGACYFDCETGEIGETFKANIDPSKFGHKFTVDYETIAWWFGQSDQARAMVLANPTGLGWALTDLDAFLNLEKNPCVWSHATFDMSILVNAFKVADLPFSIPFRNMRDIRTLMDLANHHTGVVREGVHHNALDDAKFQVVYCVEAMQKLKHGKDS